MALYKHQLDRQLRESEGRYRSVITQAGEAIVIVDCDTKKILKVNPSFRRLFWYLDEDIQSLSFYDLMALEPQDVESKLRKIITERQLTLGEQTCRCKDRSELHVEMSAGVIERGGKDTLVCVIAHDVTERKRVEEALFLANKKTQPAGQHHAARYPQ